MDEGDCWCDYTKPAEIIKWSKSQLRETRPATEATFVSIAPSGEPVLEVNNPHTAVRVHAARLSGPLHVI
jgi:hypothetical protein